MIKFTVPYLNTKVELDKRDLILSTVSAAFVCGALMATYQAGAFWYNAKNFGSMGLSQAGIGFSMTTLAAAGGALVMGVYKSATIPAQIVKDAGQRCTDKFCKALGIEEKPKADNKAEVAPKANSKAITPARDASRSKEGGNVYNITNHGTMYINDGEEPEVRGRKDAKASASRSKTPTRTARSRSTTRK